MTDSSSARTNVAVFIVILVISAVTMVYLFWRFPIVTALVTLTVLALLGVSARLARSMEVPDSAEPDGQGQSV